MALLLGHGADCSSENRNVPCADADVLRTSCRPEIVLNRLFGPEILTWPANMLIRMGALSVLGEHLWRANVPVTVLCNISRGHTGGRDGRVLELVLFGLDAYVTSEVIVLLTTTGTGLATALEVMSCVLLANMLLCEALGQMVTAMPS